MSCFIFVRSCEMGSLRSFLLLNMEILTFKSLDKTTLGLNFLSFFKYLRPHFTLKF